MKKRYIASFVAILSLGLGMSSCSDYLSVERFFKDRQSEEKIFKSKQYTEEWLAQCYGRLLGSNMEIGHIKYALPNFSDDMIFNQTDGNVNYNNFKFGQYDNGWVNDSYIRCYEGIRQTSILINNVDMNEELTKEEIADRKGQARFLRSYFYWMLLRRYGPVPIMPEETVNIDDSYIEMSTPRSTYDEVVNYIDKEMLLAAKDMPEKRDNQNINRATKGAALAVRAKALLYAASPINNPLPGDTDKFTDFVDDQGRILIAQTYDESKWARAAAAAKDVIDLANTGVYRLYTSPYKEKGDAAYPATVKPPYNEKYSKKNFPDGWADIDPFESYRALFNGDLYANENPELIFTRGNNDMGDQVRYLVYNQMPSAGGGMNRHGLTAKQCDAYGMADGSSFNLQTFMDTCAADKRFVSEDEYNKKIYPQLRPKVWKEYANREPRFYASVAYNGAFWAFTSAKDEGYRNQQIWYYRGQTEGRKNGSDQWIPTGIGMMKYINPGDCNKNEGRMYDKIDVVIRYADILLMYAEAMNELTPGNSYEVTDWQGQPFTISRSVDEMSKAIKPVRMRGGVPDYEQAVYTDQALLRKALKHERQIELMGENQRYYDLRRWKDAPTEESEQIYGCNVLMTQDMAERYYERVRVESLQANFSRKMYFWPVLERELKWNRRMTQAPGWETFN